MGGLNSMHMTYRNGKWEPLIPEKSEAQPKLTRLLTLAKIMEAVNEERRVHQHRGINKWAD